MTGTEMKKNLKEHFLNVCWVKSDLLSYVFLFVFTGSSVFSGTVFSELSCSHFLFGCENALTSWPSPALTVAYQFHEFHN